MPGSYDKHLVYAINNSDKIVQDWYHAHFTNAKTENQVELSTQSQLGCD